MLGGNLLGSPMESPISPMIRDSSRSPPRELTRPRTNRGNLSITDVTAHETGNMLHGLPEESHRESELSQEAVTLTQRQLTSEFEIAEMNALREESEIHRHSIGQELSQEVHLFNQARGLIQEMRRNFSIEDDGCIRRIEMLERQRNEYEEGMFSISQQAELLLNERNAEYDSELYRIRNIAESQVGRQNEDLVRLRNELHSAKKEISKCSRMETEFQREALSMNEYLSNELLTAKSKSLSQENEVSSLQRMMNDRNAVFLSEISNMQSTIHQQSELQVQQSGFTEDEIRMYIIKKISKFEDESRHEKMMLEAMVNSESEVARLHEERFKMVTSRSIGESPLANDVIQSLMDRLYQEQVGTENAKRKRDESDQKVYRMEAASIREEHELESTEDRAKQLWNRLESEQTKKPNNMGNNESNSADPKIMDEIKFLKSEAERLRKDRNEEMEYNKQLWDEMEQMEEHQERHEGGGHFEEMGESSR